MNALTLSRVTVFALSVGVMLATAGCGEKAQETTVFQNTEVGCPVPEDQLPDVLAGAYGVDGLSRPVNANGFAVDTDGNCLVDRPVSQVWYDAQPGPVYIGHLRTHYGPNWMWSRPVYRPLLVPSINIMRSGAPVGRVRSVDNYQVPGRTTTIKMPPRPASTMRRGEPGNSLPAGLPAQTARPAVSAGGTEHPAASAPATLRTPSRQPLSVAPAGGGVSKLFNRSATPSRSSFGGGGTRTVGGSRRR